MTGKSTNHAEIHMQKNQITANTALSRLTPPRGDYPGLDRNSKPSFRWWRQASALIFVAFISVVSTVAEGESHFERGWVLARVSQPVAREALATKGIDIFNSPEDINRLCATQERRGLRRLIDIAAAFIVSVVVLWILWWRLRK